MAVTLEIIALLKKNIYPDKLLYDITIKTQISFG